MTEKAKAKAIWNEYQKEKKTKSFQEQHKRMSELQEQLDSFNSQLTLPHIVKYREAKKVIDLDEIEEILEDNKENDSGNKQPYKFEASRRTPKNLSKVSKKGTKGGSRKGLRKGSRKGSIKGLRKGSRKRR